MRSVVVVRPNEVEVRELPKPVPGPYQALVKTDVCAVCNATDAKVVAGHFPGLSDYPLVLGHEATGIVEAVGEKVTGFRVGDRLLSGMLFEFGDSGCFSGWGGMCDYTLANDHDAMVADGTADEAHGWYECHEVQSVVPEGISADDAALLCTWREVYSGIEVFGIQPGQRVLIYGAGPVGLSFVKFGKLLGWEWVGLVDPLAWKRDLALKMGADQVFTPDESPAPFGPFDAIVDAVGSPKIMNAAVPMIKMEGKICVYGVLADDAFTLDKSTGPYNFNLLIHQWPTRRRERAAMAPLCDWIRQGRLSADEYVTARYPVEQIDEALAAVKSGTILKCLIDF